MKFKLKKLNRDERVALMDLVDQLSGGNPEDCFGVDDFSGELDPTTTAVAKLFFAAGRTEQIPAALRRAMGLPVAPPVGGVYRLVTNGGTTCIALGGGPANPETIEEYQARCRKEGK